MTPGSLTHQATQTRADEKKSIPTRSSACLHSSQVMGVLRTIRQRLVSWIVQILVKEHRGYRQHSHNDIAALKAVLRPGDVILVEGSQRISEVIKYLTQSSWSHAALYVGDAVLVRGGSLARDATEQFGEEANALLVEATVENGVGAAPLSKYVQHNMRICRPVRLRHADLGLLLETVISQIGIPYNVEHVIDLLRYFFPVTLLARWRSQALRHSGKLTKEVICSSQIAVAFQKVGYPVQPSIVRTESLRNGSRMLPGWLIGTRRRSGRSLLEDATFTPGDPSLITPRDFDLSPYFQVVKPLAGERAAFDYKRIQWSPVRQAPSPSRADEKKGAATLVPAHTFRATAKKLTSAR
jgi:hypothetical protein